MSEEDKESNIHLIKNGEREKDEALEGFLDHVRDHIKLTEAKAAVVILTDNTGNIHVTADTRSHAEAVGMVKLAGFVLGRQ